MTPDDMRRRDLSLGEFDGDAADLPDGPRIKSRHVECCSIDVLFL